MKLLANVLLFLGLALVHQVVVSAPINLVASGPKVGVPAFRYAKFKASSRHGGRPSTSATKPRLVYDYEKLGGHNHKARSAISDMMISNISTRAENITAPYKWTNVVSFLFSDTNTNTSRHCEWAWPVTYSLNTSTITPPALKSWHQCGSAMEYQATQQIFAFQFASFAGEDYFTILCLHIFKTTDKMGNELWTQYESAPTGVDLTCDDPVISGCQSLAPTLVPVVVIQ